MGFLSRVALAGQAGQTRLPAQPSFAAVVAAAAHVIRVALAALAVVVQEQLTERRGMERLTQAAVVVADGISATPDLAALDS